MAAQDTPSDGAQPPAENVFCPECGREVSLKLLPVHRNRMHDVPLPETGPSAPEARDATVPNWITDQEPPPPEPAPPEEAVDDAAVSPEVPEHDHEDYEDVFERHGSEITTLRLAVAHLDQKLAEREKEITTLQGIINALVSKKEENEIATATPIILFDTDEKRVVGVRLFFRSKGQQVEGLMRKLVDLWHQENRGIEFAGLPPNLSLRLKEDPAGRGFDLIPGNFLVVRLSRKERESLGSVLESTTADGASAPKSP